MTGQRWDSRFGRGRTGPLQIDVPVRLPGGLWGPPPATGIVSWDAQGNPESGFGVIPSASSGLTRAEWPLSVRWEVQVALSLQCLGGGNNPNYSFGPGDFRLFFQMMSYVESASARQELVLEYGPGIYPAVQNLVYSEGKPSTYVLTGQRIELSVLNIEDNGLVQLAGSSWRWTVSFLPALTASGWPA